jgi:hypothetical protein
MRTAVQKKTVWRPCRSAIRTSLSIRSSSRSPSGTVRNSCSSCGRALASGAPVFEVRRSRPRRVCRNRASELTVVLREHHRSEHRDTKGAANRAKEGRWLRPANSREGRHGEVR